MPENPCLAAHVRRQIDRVTGAAMLLHPEGAVELSESADAIVQQLDGSRSVDEIADALAAEFSADPAELRADVAAFLAQLAARGLLA